MTAGTPARLYALLPREGDRAVVFRRGPNRLTAMLSWDLRTDTFEIGQWHRGSVYARRCDLSPNGRHMIAALAKHGPIGGLGGYTVVCRPPCFTAVALFAAGHCWNGGGVFLDDRRYWVDAGGPPWSGPEAILAGATVRVPTPPPFLRTGMGEDLVLYPQRLVRDGWSVEPGESGRRTTRVVLTRDIRPHWVLRKRITASVTERSPSGEVCWETHEIEGPDGAILLGDAWADVNRSAVVFAKDGCMWRMRIHAKRPDPAILLIDTNALAPRPRAAPYHGVRRSIGA